jgi:hypothetical protein
MLTVKYKVLGVVVGLSSEAQIVNKNDDESKLQISEENGNIVFNSSSGGVSYNNRKEKSINYVLDKDDGIQIELENVFVVGSGTNANNIMYLVGSNTTAFDSWPGSYSDHFVIVTK